MRRFALLLFLVPMLAGCELSEVTVAEPETAMVAEVYLIVGDGRDQISVYLHWTVGTAAPSNLRESSIIMETEDGFFIPFRVEAQESCLLPEIPEDITGACFVALSMEGSPSPVPGEWVEVEIISPDGSTLRGRTTIPEAFDIVSPATGGTCVLPPRTPLTIQWTRSAGAWAYASETQISGLVEALGRLGIEAEADTIALLGLAVSDSDTTVVFPGEFGVFNRFNLDQDVALALQEGLPEGAAAQVVVGALDRNYVNWVRGGNFNPSGAVRVPSLRGDGTGVIASVYRRSFTVLGAVPNPEFPNCISGF